ncbi:ParB family protein [Pseudarthrobacter albicanus]|uniref:ParB family protein n=1 Tax=Pseudarthrobacter TaxID=1742993 RepID=UPI001FE8E127|nr:hypothetical protein [Pseudarthrobacter albicanus]
MNRPGPAPERGGTPSALDAVRKRAGLVKARNTSVIADMTRTDVDEQAGETQPATLHAVPAPAAAPERTPTAPPQASAEAAPVQQAPVVQAPAVQQAAAQQAPVQQAQQPQPVAYAQPVQQVPQQTQVLLRQPALEPPAAEKKMYRKTSFFQSKESGARMRSAYMATRHLTGSRTLSDFILAAVEREVEALERQYNEGNLFTADPGSVPRGRPLES